MNQTLRRMLAVTIGVVMAFTLAGGAAVAKHDVLVELFYDGQWNEHAIDAYTRDSIEIVHGVADEQRGLRPSQATLTFTTRNGARLNPANVHSDLYGKIGRGTLIRITIDGSVRFSGRTYSWKPRRAIKGDSWVEVRATGELGRLGQGTPQVESSLYRAILSSAITSADLLAYWPLEAGSAADRLGSAVSGGSAMNVPAGLILADDDTLIGSLPLPTVGLAVVNPTVGVINLTPSTGTSLTFDLWGLLPTTGTVAIDAYLVTSNGIKWNVFVDGINEVVIFHVAADGAPTQIAITSPFTVGDWHNYRLTLVQNGANVDVEIIVDGVSADTGTIAATLSAPIRTEFENLGSNSFGHVNVWDGIPSVNFYEAGRGHPGERAGNRFTRTCGEKGITATVVGTASDTQLMGPQYPDTMLNLLTEIARTDNALIFDTREQLGLTMRTGRSLYNQ